MTRRSFKTILGILWVAAALLPAGPDASALSVQIKDNRISIQAGQVPLQDILRHLVDQGVAVRIDPRLNPSVSVDFRDRDLRSGLESILKPLDHVLVWQSVATPPGAAPRLAEIRVFLTGREAFMQTLGRRSILSIEKNPEDGRLYVKNELLIRIAPGTDLAQLQNILDAFGARIVGRDDVTGTYRIRLPDGTDVPGRVKQIASYPEIAGAEPNYAYPAFKPLREPDTAPAPAALPGLKVSLETAPIAILDTGLAPEAGLQHLVAAALDVMDPDAEISDSAGHGSQMALIASGLIRPNGVSADADRQIPIIPIRAFDDNGFTSSFHLMQSMAFALQNGARVMSLSWGSETRSDFLERTLDHAAAQGLIIVASAGNDPTGRPVYPAAYDSVLAVGALDRSGTPWENSNFGAFVKLYAPGFADLPVGYQGDPGLYAGTSIAAAYTANRVAAYLSDHPGASLQEILDAFQTEKTP